MLDIENIIVVLDLRLRKFRHNGQSQNVCLTLRINTDFHILF
jgi:hypothetical protein